MSRERCTRTVSINFPCHLSAEHTGVCHPDPEDQLRLYGIKIEDIRRIQEDLALARQLGLATPGGQRTNAARGLVYRAALEEFRDRIKGRSVSYVDEFHIQEIIDRAESDAARIAQPVLKEGFGWAGPYT